MKTIQTIVFALLVAAVTSHAQLLVINGNFCGVQNIGPGADSAGIWSGNAPWNNLTLVGGFSASDTASGGAGGDLQYTNGNDVVAGVSISWTSDSQDAHPLRSTNASDPYGATTRSEQLYAGYLEDTTEITFSVSGLSAVYGTEKYSIILFIDSPDGNTSPALGGPLGPVDYVATTSGFTTGNGATIYGRDDTDFIQNGFESYDLISSTTAVSRQSGNYLGFGNLSGDGTITLTVQSGSRIALNGFEIVPEPTSALLLLASAAAMAVRRRRM